MPISWIDFIRVLLLLVDVGFMSNIEDGINHLCSFISLSELLSLLILFSHVFISLLKSLDLSCHLLLHGVKHLLFLKDSVLGV